MSVATDHDQTTTLDLLVRLADRTTDYDFSVWFWGDAIAIDGLLEASDLSASQSYRDHCSIFLQRWCESEPGWVDHLTPGMGLLRLFEATGDDRLFTGAKRLATWLRDVVPKTKGGAPLYRPDQPPYRHTVWVDTLYHEPPFFAQLAALTNDARWYDVALDIWQSHLSLLRCSGGPILGHSYDTGARLLRGHGWGRGNGWAIYGMIDTLEALPGDHPGRPQAVDDFLTLADALIALQDPSGMWRTLLTDREAYLEVSTAAFIGAAFLKGVRLGLLGDRYRQSADLAWAAVKGRVDDDGSFWGVSACTYVSTHPDDDVQMYKTLPTEVNVWGQGSALRFTAERIRSNLGA